MIQRKCELWKLMSRYDVTGRIKIKKWKYVGLGCTFVTVVLCISTAYWMMWWRWETKSSSRSFLVIKEVVPYSITSAGHGADPDFLAVSLQVTLDTDQVVGCHYFPPGPWLLSQTKKSPPPFGQYQNIQLTRRHTGVSSLLRSLCNGASPGLEPKTCKSQVRRPFNIASNNKKSSTATQVQIGRLTKSLFWLFYSISIRRVHDIDDGMRFSIILHTQRNEKLHISWDSA